MDIQLGKKEEHMTLFQHDLLNTQLFTIHTERYHTDQFFSHIWDLAKAVSQACPIGFKSGIQIVTVCQIIKFAIEQHTFGGAGDILIREIHLDIGFEGTIVNEIRAP
jgi:hypothetical protein